uniref:Thioesterase superfamily protein n=1 Tax=uncultured Bacteroidota bacterium TaxID=152509 RepID=H5SBP7_9BACT|nr:thioesterase superfamily protein [uncultured Bacteroidetes bacterium]
MAASLDGRLIHPLYSTFWLAYHAEVAARKAIEPYFDEGENALGAGIELEHRNMCPLGVRVDITATVTQCDGNRIICSLSARAGAIEIARGTQTQVVLPSERIQAMIARAYEQHGVQLPQKS